MRASCILEAGSIKESVYYTNKRDYIDEEWYKIITGAPAVPESLNKQPVLTTKPSVSFSFSALSSVISSLGVTQELLHRSKIVDHI